MWNLKPSEILSFSSKSRGGTWGVNYSNSLSKGHFVFVFLIMMNDDYVSH